MVMWAKFVHQFYDLASLPIICLLLSCILGVRNWQRLPKAIRVLVVFLVFNFLIEIAARAASILYAQNLPLLHVYTLGELWLFSLFYYQILDKTSIFKRYFYWILGVGMSLVVLNTLLLQGIFELNSFAKTLVQILIIVYALDYAFRFSDFVEPDPVLNNALQLVNAAILIYYCGSLFIFMSSQFEVQMGQGIRILWKINAVLNLIFQIMVLIALWKVTFNRPKSYSSQERVS